MEYRNDGRSGGVSSNELTAYALSLVAGSGNSDTLTVFKYEYEVLTLLVSRMDHHKDGLFTVVHTQLRREIFTHSACLTAFKIRGLCAVKLTLIRKEDKLGEVVGVVRGKYLVVFLKLVLVVTSE